MAMHHSASSLTGRRHQFERLRAPENTSVAQLPLIRPLKAASATLHKPLSSRQKMHRMHATDVYSAT